ncbi:MAG: ORF6N domain-containing protein [Fluviicola sp.]
MNFPIKGLSEEHNSKVFKLRGHLVMLASEVAKIFEVETRLVNQNIKEKNKNDPPLFPEKYAFQLTDDETTSLRSSGMIPKLTRGGSRANPWVITRKGTIRLATVMKSAKAVEAADAFIDIFDEVISGLLEGQEQVQISNPSRILPDDSHNKEMHGIRERIRRSVNDLLDTVVNKKDNKTVRDELQEVSEGAVNHVKEWLKNKKLTNEKIKAETLLIIEQARDIYERRKSELETAALEREHKNLEIVTRKIEIVERLLQVHSMLEPSAMVKMVSGFSHGHVSSIGDEQID